MRIRNLIGLATIACTATLALPGAHAATAVREPGGAIHYYDDNGFDRGYAWCANRGGSNFGSWSDCRYFSFEQCDVAVRWPPPGGFCIPNPWASQVTGPPVKPRRR